MIARIRELSACCLMVIGATAVHADPLTPQQAIERGLNFLQEDTVKWRKDKECATCHHGTMTVWALSEAKRQGYEIPAESFAETVKWTKDKMLARVDEPRVEQKDSGWRMVNSPVLYLSVMAQVLPEQDAISADELKRMVGNLLRHQETDGSWSYAIAPPKNRPPPFFESDEVATLLGYLALGSQVPADPNEKSEARDGRDRAATWLAMTEPTGTTQALAYRLLVRTQAKESAETMQPAIDSLLVRQNNDGGWGQLKDAHSDAYATGQTLYVLSLAGVAKGHDAVALGVKFLVETQNADGSWPMTRRGHPGVTPGDFKIPIIYFGSAWGTMGLMRSAPK